MEFGSEVHRYRRPPLGILRIGISADGTGPSDECVNRFYSTATETAIRRGIRIPCCGFTQQVLNATSLRRSDTPMRSCERQPFLRTLEPAKLATGFELLTLALTNGLRWLPHGIGKQREKPTATEDDGLLVSPSRGDRTAIELFAEGVRSMPSHLILSQ